MNPSILSKEDFVFIKNLMDKTPEESKQFDKTKRKIELIIEMQSLTEKYQKDAGSIREELMKLDS